MMAACFLKVSKPKRQKRECASNMKSQTEVTSHDLCCILLVRSKSPGPTHNQGEVITQRCEHQDKGES